jgi:hypothetical protein
VSRLKRHVPLRRDTDAAREFQQRGRESSARSLRASGQESARRSAPKRRAPISPASPAQRAKVNAVGVVCVGCRRPQSEWLALDPAHVTDRSVGGCDAPECVVPLCRAGDGSGCHYLYDHGELDLLKQLEPHWREEQAHAVMHLGIAGAYRRLTNDRHAGTRFALVPDDQGGAA